MQELLISCDNLIKIYKLADLEAVALQGLDLEVTSGEMLAIVGASGSGKSTLLNILGGLDVPSAGKVTIAGHNLARLTEEQRTRYRSQVIGHVWQQSGRNLLPDLTAAENIDLPQIFNGTPTRRYKRRTRELLEIVGLADMARKKPTQLSGGEQQRVAIAVALANQPPLLLADEPTGELDSVTTREIITFLRQINREIGVTIILVTHDIAVASLVDRTLAIRDGRTSTETIRRGQPLATEVTGTSAVIGLPAETHQEMVFIDRVGLLQLPTEAVEHISLRGRVDLHVAQDHVELWPAGMGDAIYNTLNTSGSSAVIGLSTRSHHEVVLVDRVGRLQLPPEALVSIPFNGRAHVRIARSHVELWPLAAAEYIALLKQERGL